MAKSIGTTTGQNIELVSPAPASGQIDAVAASPGWYVLGGFQMPFTADVRLELIGSVSEEGNTLHARLFNVTEAAVVEGSLTDDVTELVEERKLSGVVELQGNCVYQIQAECIGATGFAIVASATPTS